MSKKEVLAQPKRHYNPGWLNDLFARASRSLESVKPEDFFPAFAQDIKVGSELTHDQNLYDVMDCQNLQAVVRDFVNSDPEKKEERKEFCRKFFKDFALNINRLLDKTAPENKYFQDNEGSFSRLFFYYIQSIADIIDLPPEQILKDQSFDRNEEAFSGLCKMLFDKACFEVDVDGFKKIEDKIGKDKMRMQVIRELDKYTNEHYSYQDPDKASNLFHYSIRRAGCAFDENTTSIDGRRFKNLPPQLVGLIFFADLLCYYLKDCNDINDRCHEDLKGIPDIQNLAYTIVQISNIFYEPAVAGNGLIKINPMLLQNENLAKAVLDRFYNIFQQLIADDIYDLFDSEGVNIHLQKILRAAVKFNHVALVAKIQEIEPRICNFERLPQDIHTSSSFITSDGGTRLDISPGNRELIQRFATQDVRRGDFIDLFCHEDVLGIIMLANSEAANRNSGQDENLFYAKIFSKCFLATNRLLTERAELSQGMDPRTIRRIASYEAKKVVEHFYAKKKDYQNLGLMLGKIHDFMPQADAELMKETVNSVIGYDGKIDLDFMNFIPTNLHNRLSSAEDRFRALSGAIFESSQRLVSNENRAIIESIMRGIDLVKAQREERSGVVNQGVKRAAEKEPDGSDGQIPKQGRVGPDSTVNLPDFSALSEAHAITKL